MGVSIVTVCGAGIGTSAILKVAAERALSRLGIDATVTATDPTHVHDLAEDAQIVLTTVEHVAQIGRTNAQIVVVDSILDQAELLAKLEDALG